MEFISDGICSKKYLARILGGSSNYLCCAISLTRFLVALYVLCQTHRESRLCRRRLKCCRYLHMTGLGEITCLLDGDRGLIEMNEYLRSTGVFLDCDYSDLVSF